jgi:hypothetical protein
MDKNIFQIIPTKIKTYDPVNNRNITTDDKLFIESKDDYLYKNFTFYSDLVGHTFNHMNPDYCYFLRDTSMDKDNSLKSCAVVNNGLQQNVNCNERFLVFPRMNISIPRRKSKDQISSLNITNGHMLYGSYPQTLGSQELNNELEENYNNGNFKNGLTPTNLAYTIFKSTSLSDVKNITLKHLPEFSYNGKKYVRMSGGSSPIWFKVEPIEWEILNYNKLPGSLNPNNKGFLFNFEKNIELECVKGILSNIPFHFILDKISMPYENSPINQTNNKNYIWQNSTIRCFLNGLKDDDQDFTKCNFMNEAFEKQQLIKDIYETNEQIISSEAFDGCTFIKEIIIKDNPNLEIEKDAFYSLNLSYIARRKNDNAIVLFNDSKLNEIKDSDDYYNIAKLDDIPKRLHGISLSNIIPMTRDKNFSNFINKLNKDNMELDYRVAQKLMILPLDKNNEDSLIDYDKFYNFKYFVNEITPIAKDKNSYYSEIIEIAYLLGCFSPMEIQEPNIKSKIFLAQKATSLLAKFLKDNEISTSFYKNYDISITDYDVRPNKDFTNFLSIKDNGKYSNLELMLELNQNNFDENLFEQTVKNFNMIKSMRKAVNSKGMPYTKPWRDCIIESYLGTKFENINPENKDMALTYFEKGVSNETFEKAEKIRRDAMDNNIPSHLLNVALKEDTILDQIKKLKEESKNALQEGKKELSNKFDELIKDTYDKKFTYEMLDKYDPINAIIGVYCSCCATIDSDYYGRDIATATMNSECVQNIVIRDENGEIAAKGAMYVDYKRRYAVINDFELNEKYKKHEYEIGYYDVDGSSKDEMERYKIFKAFIRAVNDFVKEYDIENPNYKLTQVNVGMGFNRLKAQCNRLKKSDKLFVPGIYGFNDADKEQRVIYLKDDNKVLKNNNPKDDSYGK